MLRDLGHAIANYISIAPCTIGTGSTEATATGEGIDRKGFEWAVFAFSNCQPKGTPLGVTVTCKVQDSEDNSTFTDVSGASDDHNVTNTYSITELSVNLAGCERYVRGVMTVQFNGGTGPIIVCDAIGILGSAQEYPV